MNNAAFNKIINTGDIDAIVAIKRHSSLSALQRRRINAILKHVGYNKEKENAVFTSTIKFILVYTILLGFVFLVITFLTGCDNTDNVFIDREPDIINNTYVTQEYITNITEVTEIVESEGASIVAFIFPCGSGNNKEVLLKLSSGDIVAVYDGDTNSDLQQTRLSVLANGNYVTTFGNGDCNFTVLNGNVTGPKVVTQEL